MDALDRLKNAIHEYGMLLLNENKYFPSVISTGGDWGSVLLLIERREIFLSKIFMNRTTYLSAELYSCLKPFKQPELEDEAEKTVYRFLQESGGCETEVLKAALPLGKKETAAAMDRLLAGLHITVLKRGKTLNDSWSSYVWGTSGQWERQAGRQAVPPDRESCGSRMFEILGKSLPEKQILKLMK